MSEPKYDEIGIWSEVKLDIIKDYAVEYSKILAAQRKPSLSHLYVDAFAGAGVHISKESGQWIPGSPLNALRVTPPFKEYHFVDLDGAKADALRNLAKNRADVQVYEGDCNDILIKQIFPRARFEEYRRALCILDPYGLHLDWEVVKCAGGMKSVELFINFPVMDINRNVLRHNPNTVTPEDAARMTQFWGDDSWKTSLYPTQGNLFKLPQKADNDFVAKAYRERLKKVAGFSNVPEPLPMRNDSRAIVYYLFFASQKPVAQTIVNHIFKKYRERGAN